MDSGVLQLSSRVSLFIPLHKWHAASCTGTKPWIWALITRSRTIRYGCNSQGDRAVWQPSDQSCSVIHFSAVDASWSDFSRKPLGAPLWAKSSCTPWFLHISRSSVGQNQSVPPATDDCEKPNWALRRFAISQITNGFEIVLSLSNAQVLFYSNL